MRKPDDLVVSRVLRERFSAAFVRPNFDESALQPPMYGRRARLVPGPRRRWPLAYLISSASTTYSTAPQTFSQGAAPVYVKASRPAPKKLAAGRLRKKAVTGQEACPTWLERVQERDQLLLFSGG